MHTLNEARVPEVITPEPRQWAVPAQSLHQPTTSAAAQAGAIRGSSKEEVERRVLAMQMYAVPQKGKN